MIPFERAIEVFGLAFSYGRSFTHPYEFVRIGPLWVMRDGPRRSGEYRAEEVLVHGVAPDDAVNILREYAPSRFFLAAIEPMTAPFDDIKQAYKARGFRLLRREPFMVRTLSGQRAIEGPYAVRRVVTRTDADAVAEAAGRRQIRDEHLTQDASLRLYAAFDGDRVVGFVKSLRPVPEATWVSNMYVRPEWRRRGIARSLMSRMLVDDEACGARYSVLLSSNSGSKLYPTLGYEQIGLLQLFAPIKGQWQSRKNTA